MKYWITYERDHVRWHHGISSYANHLYNLLSKVGAFLMKAFPIVIDRGTQIANNTNYGIQEEGMDLRDYFAAKAMQGIIDSSIDSGLETIQIAKSAYLIADAMMEVRE